MASTGYKHNAQVQGMGQEHFSLKATLHWMEPQELKNIAYKNNVKQVNIQS